MSWAKLSDDFADDCWTLSDAAFRLHVEGLTWNGRKLLDCVLQKADVRRFAKHPDAAAELVDLGWWQDVGDSYIIRHHASYQRQREDVLKQQEANRENGRKGGRPKSTRERVEGETQSLSESVPETQSLSESKTERDRTGQAQDKELPSQTETEISEDWAIHCSMPDCDGAVTDYLMKTYGRYCAHHADERKAA